MRLKYYLRGAGIGIFFTALILTIAFAFQEPKVLELSDDEIIEKATELGMVMATDDTVVDETTKEEDASLIEETGEADAGDETDSDEEDQDESVTYVAFTVSPGDSSNAVAYNLKTKGIIDDDADFNSYMNRLGIDSLIQAGTFYIKTDIDYEDLVALLVTKQADRDTTPPVSPEDAPEAEEAPEAPEAETAPKAESTSETTEN